MRLAFYTYSYTDRLNLPIPESLAFIKKTGYSGIDISGTHGNSDDPRSFDADRRKLTRATAEKLGLHVEVVITHAQLTDSLAASNKPPLDLMGSVDLAVDVGAPLVSFHMGGYHEGMHREKEWDVAVENIKKACGYGAKKNVSLMVDGIWPVWINDRPEALQQLFDDVGADNFGVNFDPSYLTLIKIDPGAFAKQFSKQLYHCHLKDHRGTYEKWDHLVPGDGEMDYSAVLTALDEIGYSGALAVECFQDNKFEDACRKGFRAMSSAAEGADVRFASYRKP